MRGHSCSPNESLKSEREKVQGAMYVIILETNAIVEVHLRIWGSTNVAPRYVTIRLPRKVSALLPGQGVVQCLNRVNNSNHCFARSRNQHTNSTTTTTPTTIASMRIVEVIIDGFKSYAVRTVISGWYVCGSRICGARLLTFV